jgi:hypothetical protein
MLAENCASSVQQRFGNPRMAKWYSDPNDKDLDMATIFELISMLAMLVLGFILGRIWEIRREMRRNHHIAQGGPHGTPADQVETGYRVPTAYL